MTSQTNNQTPHSPTPDSYDTHIIPAETAARKEREGDNYKHIPEHAEGADSIATAGGYSVDTEGLVNNYAMEPEMYHETPGDMWKRNDSTSSTDQCTIIDTFPSPRQAERVVEKMQAAGLDTHQISILGKNYEDTAHVHGALNWKDISQAHGLAVVLVKLGISSDEALKHETDVEAGKFVVIVTGSEEDISKAYQILHGIGHEIS